MASIKKEYIINDRGAKVYLDPSNHEMLLIPEVADTSHKGLVYEVLSVGFHYQTHSPCITIQEDDGAVLYLLPMELANWVRHCLLVAQVGGNFFPAKVEFGELTETGRIYAEVL